MKLEDEAQGPRATLTTEPGLPGHGSLGSDEPRPRPSLAPLSDIELRAQLDEVNRELASLRRRIDDLCKRGAALADEQHRRATLADAHDPVELPSGSFRALSRF